MSPVVSWLRAHGLTVIVAILMFLLVTFVTRGLSRGSDACTSVNKVLDYVDALVQKSTASATAPPAHVADPEVQKLIDNGRKDNEDFKRFAEEQSKKARCHV